MNRHKIIKETGISQTSFTGYLQMKIIIATSKNEGVRDYDPASIERVKAVRRLTPLGFRLEDVKRLLDRHNPEEIISKVDSLTMGEFQKWFKKEVPET